MSSGNDYCDGDGDIEDDGYSDGDDNIDGFAHNDFDDDDGDGVLQKRNLDNNKASTTGVSENAILNICCQMKHNHPHRHCD